MLNKKGFIALPILIGVLVVLGIIGAAGFAIYRNNSATTTNNIAPAPADISPSPNKSPILGETSVSFTNTDSKILFKTETNLNSPIIYYGFPDPDKSKRDQRRNIVTVYNEDDGFDPVGIPNIDPGKYQWTALVSNSLQNPKVYPDASVSDSLFSYQVSPTKDNILFVMDWNRSYTEWGPNFGTPHLLPDSGYKIYLYSLTDPNKGLQIIPPMIFGNYAIPKIEAFDDSGRYAVIDLFRCWGCGEHVPYRMLLDTKTLQSKNIGEVIEFKWRDNGAYEYKEVVAGSENCPEDGQCIEDPNK